MEPLFATYPSWSLLVIRLALGIIFFAHGAQKVLGWFGGYGLKGTIGYFQQALKIPPALTIMAALTEFLGGAALIVGFLARPVGVGLIILMLVAVAKAHWANGFFINWSLQPGKGHGFEMNFALMAMALAVLIGGAGILSIDRMIYENMVR
jgi:putative oxidoreductase